MRNNPFPLAVVLIFGMVCSSYAAEKPRPVQGNRSQPKKVWTNDDMDQLRGRSVISIVGREPTQAAQAPAAAEPSRPAFPVYESRLDDPAWYADQAADLQAELDRRLADLQQQHDTMELARDRVSQAGIATDKPSAGVTPTAALAIFQAKVQEIQTQLDELADVARHHNIPPGVLRG